jgi:pyruvate carboxylase subunit B
MVLGYYGNTPVEPDKTVVELAKKQLNLGPTNKTVIELQDEDPSKGIDAAIKVLKENNLDVNDENIFIVASCKNKGVQYLLGNAKVMIRKKVKKPTIGSSSSYSIALDGTTYSVQVENNKVLVDGHEYEVSIGTSEEKEQPVKTKTSSQELQNIQAPMAGQVLKILKKKGDTVREGDVVFMLEAMKMEIEVKTPFSGTIVNILTHVGDAVYADQKLLEIQ